MARVGYSFWGFMSDYKIDADTGKELSTPDGNAFYSWVIIYELIKQGHEVYLLMPDRDVPALHKYGAGAFDSFSSLKRNHAYKLSKHAYNEFPNLDLLLMEWRFPTSRNSGDGTELDLKIQNSLLEFYNKIPKIVLDLDYKLTEKDERKWKIDKVLETSLKLKIQYSSRSSVSIPFYEEDALQFPMEDSEKKIVYVGSRYERDDIIDKYIGPFAINNPGIVHFYGNWKDYPVLYKEALERWPGIEFYNRITIRQFRNTYKNAAFCPLLAKQEYLKNGFMTARLLENLVFGTIPMGLKECYGIDMWTPYSINDWHDLNRYLKNDWSAGVKEESRKIILRKIQNKIDPVNFVNALFS